MNISKNILSLGLIAVISGISTAQTYTGTAGTNGITDIQSDYSMSTGDGASVSVDVPLEFELPKKVAIAIRDTSGNFANGGIFGSSAISLMPPVNFNSSLDKIAFNGQVHPSNSDASSQNFIIGGIVYTNSENVNIQTTVTDFIHESDSTSIISPFDWGGSTGLIHGRYRIDSGQTNYMDMTNITVSASELSTQGGFMPFYFVTTIDLRTIDPTDRAGRYLATKTITVSTL